MKRVLFLTNYPSPYRVCFFDELGKSMDVTVLFSDRIEEKKHRNADWYVRSSGSFKAVQLERRAATIGSNDLCLDVMDWVKKDFDAIVVSGYSNPTVILAMAYMRIQKIPFYMEVDGGLIREQGGFRYHVKKMLVSAANYWISSGDHTTDYLVHYGAKRERVLTYPFTSLWERDILPQPLTYEDKRQLRAGLDMPEKKIILYVGRFTEEKGMDALLDAASELDGDAGIYFIGGEAGEAHRALCREKNLKNVHFVGFKKKDELAEYYRAADLLVLPTYSDVWGLVVNEAMANGLPVVTTDRCVAGLELVRDGVNGYIVPVKDREALVEKVNAVLGSDYARMGAAALETIRTYTIENMAKTHVEIFENGR